MKKNADLNLIKTIHIVMKQTKNQGYIVVSRKAFDVRINDVKNVKTFEEGWIRLLTLVNYSDAEVNLGNLKTICHEGESVRQIKSWAAYFGWSRYRTVQFFRRLIALGLIHTSIMKGHFFVEVLNFHQWVCKHEVTATVDLPSAKRAFGFFWAEYERLTGIPKSDEVATFKVFRELTKEEMEMAYQNIQPYFDAIYEAQGAYKKSAKNYLRDRSFVMS